MKLYFFRFLLEAGLAGALILAGCRPQSTPEATIPRATTTLGASWTATQAANTPTPPAPATETPFSAYPGPGVGAPTVGAYPPPVQGTPVSPYPGPGAGSPDQSTSFPAYPGPGTVAPTQPTSTFVNPYPGPGTQSPTQPPDISAYPGPGSSVPTPVPPANPYPGPGTETPVQTQAASNPITPTATLLPSPTPTPAATLPRPTEVWIIETDPDTVELASGKAQFVVFLAHWDTIFRAMAPIIKELEEEYGDRINFIYLDIDNPETAELKRELRYRRQPQYFLLDETGKVMIQWQDYVLPEQFEEAFQAVLR